MVWEKAAKGRDFNVVLGQVSVDPTQAVKPKTQASLATQQKRTFYIDPRDNPRGSFVSVLYVRVMLVAETPLSFNYRSGAYLEAFSIKPPTTPEGAAAEPIPTLDNIPAFDDSPMATPTPVLLPKVDPAAPRVRLTADVHRHVNARPATESEAVPQKAAKVEAADNLQVRRIPKPC